MIYSADLGGIIARTSAGVIAIPSSGRATSSAFESMPVSLSSLNTSVLSWLQMGFPFLSTKVEIQTGSTSVYWRDDFNDGVDPSVTDQYSLGRFPAALEESSGTLKVKSSGGTSTTFWIQSGQPLLFYPKGSRVQARVRVNTSAAMGSQFKGFTLTAASFQGSTMTMRANEWMLIEFVSRASFNSIGGSISVAATGWNHAIDNVEIDWVSIEAEVDSWGPWQTISGNGKLLDLSTISTSSADLMRVRFSGDGTVSESGTLTEINIGSGYEAIGTLMWNPVELKTSFKKVTADADLPSGTSIELDLSEDGTAWTIIALDSDLNATLPKDVGKIKHVRARLQNSNRTLTPVLRKLTFE
jgi:hypothetical protein